MGKKELGNNNLLMRLNKRIGSRNVITAIAATVFIIIFLIGNYICNVISATLSSNYNNLFGAAQLVRLRAFRHPFTTFLFFLFLVADVAYVLILTYRIYTSYTDMNIGRLKLIAVIRFIFRHHSMKQPRNFLSCLEMKRLRI